MLLAGFVAQRVGDVGFDRPGRALQDDVLVFDEVAADREASD